MFDGQIIPVTMEPKIGKMPKKIYIVNIIGKVQVMRVAVLKKGRSYYSHD